MGRIEQEASRKVIAGEPILIKTKMTFLDILLYPYRAIRNLNRRRVIRNNIFRKP